MLLAATMVVQAPAQGPETAGVSDDSLPDAARKALSGVSAGAAQEATPDTAPVVPVESAPPTAVDVPEVTPSDSPVLQPADARADAAPVLAPDSAFAPRSHRDRHYVVLSADLLGFVTFGPLVSAEVALGAHGGLSAGFRFARLGLVTQLYMGDNLESVWTTRFGLRLYPVPGHHARGLYLGPILEFGKSTFESHSDQYWADDDDRRWSYRIVIAGGEIGCKWVWPSGFSLDLGDNIGGVFSKKEGSAGAMYKLEFFVFYMLSVRLGYAF